MPPDERRNVQAPRLTVRAIRAAAVEIPMTYALGTSAATVRAAPLLLVDLETEEGVTGHAYLFCYLPAAAPAIGDQDGVRHRRRRRVLPGGGDPHFDAVGGQHLERGLERRLRQRMRVDAEEERPVDLPAASIQADRLADREHVRLVEAAV